MTPFENFWIGQARIGHVAVDGVGAIKIRSDPGASANGFIILVAFVADPIEFFRIKKMKFSGKRGEQDKTTVIYNNNITMQDIPIEVYDYVVNGKSALDWVMALKKTMKKH